MSVRPAILVALVLGGLAMPVQGARQRAGNVDAFIVLDESGSMKPIFPRVTAYLAQALVQDYLVPDDYLCVVGFSSQPHVRISQRLSSEAEKANLALMVRDLNVVPQGFTDMGRALEETLKQLDRLADPSHQQIVLILTDGQNHPPRDSPYFSPLRPDRGGPLPPPSRFNDRFLAQVQRLATAGWRIHVIGIGPETDAKALAEALGSGYTVVREFDPQEIQAGLARFWDDAVNLASVQMPGGHYLPGTTVAGTVRLTSRSEKDREIHLRAARVARLTRTRSSGVATPDASALTVTLANVRWAVPARKDAAFDLSLTLPRDFPPGDYTATLAFDQQSAVRFFPMDAAFSFHVPSFWELHGMKVVAASLAGLLAATTGVLYRRRPVSVALAIEGEPRSPAKPVRLPIGGACVIGGGATDRLRVAGLPPKVAVLERRSVHRYALISTQPEAVPTLLDYALGDPVEVRLSGERRAIRLVRVRGGSGAPKPQPRQTPRPRPPAGAAPGGVDFR